jgi:phosphoglycolate phosphatase
VTIVLFDIDGTLIRTGGAGVRAMTWAFDDVFAVVGAFDGIPMAGRTDRRILEDAAARHGVNLSPQLAERFRRRYCERLLEALLEPGHRQDVLPGVLPLLDALAARSDVFLALLTGNCERGARLKLEHFGLWRFFHSGAFGDDVLDRNDLFGVAVARTREHGVPEVPARNVFVVGDTELDVECAMAAGARSVAVATGPSSFAALHQTGADIVFEDLSDTEAFLGLLP